MLWGYPCYSHSEQAVRKNSDYTARSDGRTLENPLRDDENTIKSWIVKNETFMTRSYQDKERNFPIQWPGCVKNISTVGVPTEAVT
jgi:hypothetical protein